MPGRTIRGVLGKFADLPQEAEDEIRGLVEARRRIAQLERQIKSVNGSSRMERIDPTTVSRAIAAAVERERVESQGKMEQGRVRFQRVVAALASPEHSLTKVKELLEKTEREWLVPETVDAAPAQRTNGPERAVKPATDLTSLGEELDGTLKLAAGERRILTALAQYPAGRSKVQVAVLTGYAATGGGFNNYISALRSRGLIEGDGDNLRISEPGIRTLGSWEPLPVGSALIGYWRNRLGKAERLILEALAQVYPEVLTKEQVAANAGYEPSGGGFNNALGRLRTLELVQGRGELRASDNLFNSPE
jgi:hypothetical protein